MPNPTRVENVRPNRPVQVEVGLCLAAMTGFMPRCLGAPWTGQQ
jgi:hypothetical protein